MKHFLFYLSLQFLFMSCHQKASPEEAKQFAIIIHTNTTGEIRNKQQSFVNKMAETLSNFLKSDIATVDTKELRDLLEKAKKANHLSYTEISKIQEVDDKINLRKKALAENELFRSLYENDLTKMIEVIESDVPNKIPKIRELATLFSDKEEEIKNVQKTAKEASEEFSEKYNITFPRDP